MVIINSCELFNKIPWFVFLLCLVGFMEGAAVNGVVNIVLTTLEKRFGLASSESGLIVCSTDVGAILLVLFVSYFGAKSNRPRWIAIGTFIMALGSVIFVIPHPLSEEYSYRGVDNIVNASKICSANNTDPCGQDSTGSGFLYVFMLAQFVHGVGFTPMFTLGTAYIDDNAKAESTALYLGVIYANTVLGIAAGYVGGGQFLNLWVDFDRVDTTEIYKLFKPADSVWIGAWWMGFIVTAILFFLFAIPVLGFPKKLPGTACIREARITDEDRKRMKVQKCDTRPLYKKVLDFPKSILVLLKVPTYLVIILGACAETLLTSGLAAFAPKVLEEKFDISPADAGFIMGGVTLGAGAGGMVLGGIIIKTFKLGIKNMLRLCGTCSLLAMSVGAGFFINCPEVPFAGLNKEYVLDGGYNPTNSLLSTCNSNCNCSTFSYEPVCSANGVTYFSPCHAGCGSDYITKETGKEYMSCGCIITNQTIKAKSGKCGKTCDLMISCIILLFLGMFITLTTVTPASVAILRCVPDEHKALGLGLQWVTLRLLGMIPGPVLIGYVIDTSCRIWQDNCGNKGSCFVYDRDEMSWRLFVWWCVVKVFSAATFFLASWIVIKTPSKNEISVEAEKNGTSHINDVIDYKTIDYDKSGKPDPIRL